MSEQLALFEVIEEWERELMELPSVYVHYSSFEGSGVFVPL